MREGETLTDALHIAVLRYYYDDKGVDYCTDKEKQEILTLLNTLVSESSTSNVKLVLLMKAAIKKMESPQLKARINDVLVEHSKQRYAEHSALRINRKQASATSDSGYITLWKKSSGNKSGGVGVKRITPGDDSKNAEKYLNQWLIKNEDYLEAKTAKAVRERQLPYTYHQQG